jgi:3-dehydrosphinganine reductase
MIPSDNAFGLMDRDIGGSSGIGFDLAKEYLKRGAQVTIIARNQKKLDQSKQELELLIEAKSLTSQIQTLSVDLSGKYADIEKSFLKAIKTFGKLNASVHQ